MKTTKTRICKVKDMDGVVCGAVFTPRSTTQVACSWMCALHKNAHDKVKLAEKAATEQRVAHRAAKEKAKTRGDYAREAQMVFNAFIRARDANDGCISCNKPSMWDGQWHASHYYATSIRPNLRFNENNVHKSCSVCNNYMHGNLTPYREKLMLKIGIEEMAILDEARAPSKLSIQDLKDIKDKYAKLTKELKR